MLLKIFGGYFLAGMLARWLIHRINRRNDLGFRLDGHFFIWLLTMIFASGVLSYVTVEGARMSVRINEICSTGYTDEEENFISQDYIELYNSGFLPVNVGGLRLSDREDGRGMAVENVMIPGGGYLLVHPEGFGISDAGEIITLTDSKGKVRDRVELPQLETGTSFARKKDGGKDWMVQYPTPEAKNDSSRYPLPEPVFSFPGGFYEEGFELEIEVPEGTKVYYSMDSRNPITDGYRYQGPIPIRNVSNSPNVYRDVRNVVRNWQDYYPPTVRVEKCQVIRAVTMDDNGNTSRVVTQSYFVNMDHMQKYMVVSLVADPDSLFGDTGIYVTGKEYDSWYTGGKQGDAPEMNFMRRGMESEIPAAMEIYSGEEQLASQPVGIRIQGAGSRQQADKRFSVYARKEYAGSRYFDVNFFGSYKEKLHSFILREAQADCMAAGLLAGRAGLTTLDYVPAELFLDGEYWYRTYLRQKPDEDVIGQKYGIARDKIEIAEQVPRELLELRGDYNALTQKLDMQSYLDFAAATIYLNNTDQHDAQNVRFWRYTGTPDPGDPLRDGRWRLILFDLDALTWNDYNYDMFENFNNEQHGFYNGIKGNETFRRQFVTTFMDLVNNEFSVDKVQAVMDEFGLGMTWHESYFLNRGDYIVPRLAEEYGLSGDLVFVKLETDTPALGTLTINTITPDMGGGSWQGVYFTDYPVTVTAEPNRGSRFVGWLKDGEFFTGDAAAEVELSGGCTLRAVFEEE